MKARELFGETGFPVDHVTLKLGYEDDIAHDILSEARVGGCGTIVVSRYGSNGLKRMVAEASRITYCATHPASRCGSWNGRRTQAAG